LYLSDGVGKEKRWSFNVVLQRLKSIVKMNGFLDGEIVNSKLSKPDKEQAQILNLLKVNLK
jgi:hypothetical protein